MRGEPPLTINDKAKWLMIRGKIFVPRMSYRGADPRKLEKRRADSELCAKIEVVLQREYDKLQPGEIHAIMAHNVAWEINADPDQVRRIMARIDGGSNGVTFAKPPLPDEPWEHQKIAQQPSGVDIGPSDEITADGRMKLGDRVLHAKFGIGLITHISGDMVTAVFGDLGDKRVLQTFLQPQP